MPNVYSTTASAGPRGGGRWRGGELQPRRHRARADCCMGAGPQIYTEGARNREGWGPRDGLQHTRTRLLTLDAYDSTVSPPFAFPSNSTSAGQNRTQPRLFRAHPHTLLLCEAADRRGRGWARACARCRESSAEVYDEQPVRQRQGLRPHPTRGPREARASRAAMGAGGRRNGLVPICACDGRVVRKARIKDAQSPEQRGLAERFHPASVLQTATGSPLPLSHEFACGRPAGSTSACLESGRRGRPARAGSLGRDISSVGAHQRSVQRGEGG